MKIRTVFASALATLVLGATTIAAPLPPVINNPGDLFAPGSTVSTSSPIFTWDPVAGATGYGLYIVDVENNVVVFPNMSGPIIPLTGPPFVLPPGHLPGGKSYSWTMTTFNGSTESAPSIPRYFQTAPSSLQPPPVLTGTQPSAGSFVANWARVFGLTNYVVDVSSSSTFSSFINGGLNIQAGSNTSLTIGGLDSGTTYYYRVRAYNLTSTSGNSPGASATTLPTGLPAPNPGDASEVTSNSFRAHWNGVISANGYLIDISTSSTFDTFIRGGQDLNVGNTFSVLVTGLTTNTTYYYRVRSYNAGGTSSPSTIISVTTATLEPVAPVALAPSGVSDTSFVANWSIVSGATAYLLDVSLSSSFATIVSGLNGLDVGNVTNKTVSGMKSGSTYYYRLRARNGFGAGPNSNTKSVQIAPPVLLVKSQNNSVVLSWPTNEPAYKLFYSTNLLAKTWISNNITPAKVAGKYTLTNSISTGARVYRLKK